MFITFLLAILLASSISATPLQSKNVRISPRILNGEKAKPSQFPYMVSLREYDEIEEKYVHQCGGALISDRWVLSASHCFCFKGAYYNFISVQIWIGTNDIWNDGDLYNVHNVILHEKFHQYERAENDIALIQTRTRVIFNNRVQPIAISRTWIKPGQEAIICGFGTDMKGIVKVKVKYSEKDNISFCTFRCMVW